MLYRFDDGVPTLIGDDKMEPEDVMFCRDLNFLVNELNFIASKLNEKEDK
jgi:hypothetical protein